MTSPITEAARTALFATAVPPAVRAGMPAGNAELRFDGKTYPSNPTVPPAEPAQDLEGAEILIPRFDSYRDGKPVPLPGN